MKYYLIVVFSALFFPACAQFSETAHRALLDGEIPVSEPGYYGESGKTYVLVNSISSPGTPIFLGNNVTLDLNGYEIIYADAAYEHIPNYSFEEGLAGWDVSKAPNARIGDTRVHVFVGENVLRLNAGEEITSSYITLPVADRSYFAMCGVARPGMKVSVYVEDAAGDVVYSTNSYGNLQLQGSPVENKTVQLGGGFVYAHFKGKPAGKYRIRVRADSDAIIDHIDIRPAMDAGIGVVEKTSSYAHTDYLYKGGFFPAFYDYTEDFAAGTPKIGIPVVVSGDKGTITIKNGTIRSGVRGILSYGIQSTANNVDFVIDNIKAIASGINTNAVEVRQGTIRNCYFDIESPFIINRHGVHYYAVDLSGGGASEVSYSEFYGGQGCLNIQGQGSKVHHNYFQNRQMVTNHYSIMAGGDYSKIYNNVFKPETGSGVEIYKGNHIEIFDNEFHIRSSPPTSEYGHEEYSVNGVRIADYNTPWGSSSGTFENKIYRNTFHITGKDFPEYPKYVPVATALFYSASAGHNYVYDNKVIVNAQDPHSKAETTAFYIGGGTVGGVFENNTITTNVPGFWVASMYGAAKNVTIKNNRIIKASNALDDYKPIRVGFYNHLAKDVSFVSNEIVGGSGKVDFEATDRAHTYSVAWELTVEVKDKKGKPRKGVEVTIYNKAGDVVLREISPESGSIKAVLPEYLVHDGIKQYEGAYRIVAGKEEVSVTLDRDTEVSIKVRKYDNN